ncbi:acyltransferase family protein [Deinococcus multiflagellatus]|uniref:Acyltransferase family protein n=1 Tax=Deinococcus multiflagellatus TaxID=1656887 RepID=A0ABW1ZSB4_9DEIO|nr:acyltransferase [Deinococcus multiflagellatus]MBZ9715778.1 acyltransferase [Deinococcus multiflagellatus]
MCALQVPFPTALRESGLDGARGVAALAVVLSHIAALTYVPWGPRAPTPAEFVLWHLGAPSVDLFFVFSGFVVAGSLLRRPQVGPYLWRRWIRLAPVAYVAVGLGLLARWAAEAAPPGFSLLVTDHLRQSMTAQDLWGAITLSVPALDANRLNPPLWTLVVEMQVALLMPLLTKAARWPWTLALVLLLAVSAALHGWTQALSIPLFMVGAILAHRAWRLPHWAALPALLLGLGVLLQRHVTGSDDPFVRYLTAPGAALIVLALTSGAAGRLLATPALQWLGRVSYSLYASHFPLLLTGAVLGGHLGLPPAYGAAFALPFCVLAAVLIHRYLEQPMVRRLSSPAPILTRQVA